MNAPGSRRRLRLILVVIDQYDTVAVDASHLRTDGDIEFALLLGLQPHPVALQSRPQHDRTTRMTGVNGNCTASEMI